MVVMEGRVFVIGDVHGCLSTLKRLLDKIPWDPVSDTLIFVGDYIDRGENPKGVVDLILSLKEQGAKIECLLGNHEAMLLDYLKGKNRDLYLLNGGTTTLASYRAQRKREEDPLIPEDHLSFFSELKPYIEFKDYYIVHAGFRPGKKIEEQSLEDMIWIRYEFIDSDYDFGKKVIFGHTPFEEPLVTQTKIGIDTGAVYGNKLTCIQLPDEIFYFEKSE